MKKFSLLTMISMMLLMGTTYATESKSAIPSPPGFWIRFDFSFHRPKTSCKSGFGICVDVTAGIDSPIGNTDPNLCPVKAQLNDRNQLVVEITAESLGSYENGSTLPYFKDKTSITILDPYTLSPATCKALGSTTPLTIKPGSYPVSFANGVYTVVFQL